MKIITCFNIVNKFLGEPSQAHWDISGTCSRTFYCHEHVYFIISTFFSSERKKVEAMQRKRVNYNHTATTL